jgi:hypothetical protein
MGNWFHDVSEDLNPYTPPEAQLELHHGLTGEGGRQKNMKPPSLRRAAIRWFLVCSISAVPSFYLGSEVSEGQFAAMVLGVLIFASGYTILDYKTALTDLRQNRLMSITLRSVYITRMLLTLFFPIGLVIDMSCGILSVGCTEALFGGNAIETFPGALFTTLTQGAVLNVVLAIYGLLVAGLVMLFAPLFRSVRTWLFGPSIN